MRWRAGERPKKNWASCGVFWTSTRGEPDEHRSELDFAGGFADAGLDVTAFYLARRGAGGAVCRGRSGLPACVGGLQAGCRRARIDAGVAGHHIHVVASANESGRWDGGGRSYDVGGNVHPKRDRAVGLPSPSRWISNRTADGDVVASGSMVPGSSFAEPENRGRIDFDRKNEAQRDQGGGGGAGRKMPAAATMNGV